jgi:hypothetical protein
MKIFILIAETISLQAFNSYAAYCTSISVFLQKYFLDHFAEFYIHLGAMPV